MQLIELETTPMTPPTYRKILLVVMALARVYMSCSRILFCIACFIIGNQFKVIGIQMERKGFFRVGNLQFDNPHRQYTSGGTPINFFFLLN